MCVCVFSLSAQGNKTECGVKYTTVSITEARNGGIGKVHLVPFLPLLESNSKQRDTTDLSWNEQASIPEGELRDIGDRPRAGSRNYPET